MANGAEQRVRIADVAREAGVSKAAVSFAFNNPGRLSAETAARIREVATRMGYRPHPVALTRVSPTRAGVSHGKAADSGYPSACPSPSPGSGSLLRP